jgi:hypothetical protein
MKVEQTEYFTIITAEESLILADKNGNPVGKQLYLGNIDSPDNYIEIDAPEEGTED